MVEVAYDLFLAAKYSVLYVSITVIFTMCVCVCIYIYMYTVHEAK